MQSRLVSPGVRVVLALALGFAVAMVAAAPSAAQTGGDETEVQLENPLFALDLETGTLTITLETSAAQERDSHRPEIVGADPAPFRGDI